MKRIQLLWAMGGFYLRSKRTGKGPPIYYVDRDTVCHLLLYIHLLYNRGQTKYNNHIHCQCGHLNWVSPDRSSLILATTNMPQYPHSSVEHITICVHY